MVSISVSQIIKEVKHFLMYLLAFLISSFVKFLFGSSDHFFLLGQNLSLFFFLVCSSSLFWILAHYILNVLQMTFPIPFDFILVSGPNFTILI